MEHWNKLYAPVAGVLLLFSSISWLNYFFTDAALSEALRSLNPIANVVVLTFFRFCMGKYSTYSIIAANVIILTWVQLSFHGVIPGQDEPVNLSFSKDFWYYVLFSNFFCNYNTFLSTMIFFPAINIGFYYF